MHYQCYTVFISVNNFWNNFTILFSGDKVPELETKKSEIVQIPNSSVDLNDSESSKLLILLSDLEDLDDVTKVFSSANFSEKSIEEFSLG